ncbi:hypothetical protein DFQ10_11137 [Winogradskyella eximia]|uniref:Uncharacterized protein n=1 Tax=Winogradskyella eximia TaxID=262006 RepID=A0A3D9GR21_9FLAO|nr:hypothetical protein [Winogradskyella eximia]RED38216.1 hypothetical protein DFQ10_11137 [Winogradskyella eximia]
MKRFLLHTSFFLAILLASVFVVFASADGTTDAYYKKVSSPKQSSMIVGSSRASQGIQPHIIDSVLRTTGLFNYGFTINISPYGETYYNSISNKLNAASKNGLFIVAVTPWSLSEYKLGNKKEGKYLEDDDILAKTSFVNMNPNIEYLIESLNSKNESIIRNKFRKGMYQTFFVNNNGWLEVTIESDMITNKARTQNKIVSYKKRKTNYSGFSEYRCGYLKKTIELFKEHGQVYLVRIPVVDAMLEIENELVPNFDDIMNDTSKEYGIPYINMMPFNDQYNYTDGNHLTVSSGKKFSLDLAIQINKLKK